MRYLPAGEDAGGAGAGAVIRFVVLVAVAHTVTYFVVGALAFVTLTHGLYEGAEPLFGSYLRTPAEVDLWRHVTTWFLPAQLVRGVLIGVALSPFLPVLRRWHARQAAVVVAGLYLVIGFWAAAAAAPGNIEGLVYLRPEFGLETVLRVQPEFVAQGVAMSVLVALGTHRHGGMRKPDRG